MRTSVWALPHSLQGLAAGRAALATKVGGLFCVISLYRVAFGPVGAGMRLKMSHFCTSELICHLYTKNAFSPSATDYPFIPRTATDETFLSISSLQAPVAPLIMDRISGLLGKISMTC